MCTGNRYLVIGAMAAINNLANSTALRFKDKHHNQHVWRSDFAAQGSGESVLQKERKTTHLEFLVVDVPQGKPPLLSGRDAQALQYLRIYADKTHAVDREGTDSKTAMPRLLLQPGTITKENVLKGYSSVFKPACREPLDSPLHIEMDPDVTPVHAPRRHVPVAKLDRVNDELKRLSEMNLKPSQVTADTLQRIRTETSKDPAMAALYETVTNGWADERKEVPEPLRLYWSYKDEISAYGGVLYKSHKVIVPTSLRPEMVKKVHKKNQDQDSSIQQDRESLLWPGMQAAIRETCLA
ncbi:hypothetical protein ACROYT_G001229 [Oculina patagonica]